MTCPTDDTPNGALENTDDQTGSEGASDSVTSLPSGRSLLVRSTVDEYEMVEIRSSDGALEVRITLTDQGPVLSLSGARLELQASDTVAVSCRRFEVNTSEEMLVRAGTVGVHSQGQIHMKSQDQTFIDGDYVNLNCLDRSEYQDADICDDPGDRLKSLLPESASLDQPKQFPNAEDE